MMDLILSWLCAAVAELFEGLIEFFSGVFGYDIALFNTVFSYAGDAYGTIQKVSLALALVISAWQVINFFWRGAEKAADTPARAALNAVIAIGFIYYGNYIFDLILAFSKYPYAALGAQEAVNGEFFSVSVGDFLVNQFSGATLVYLIMLILIGFSMVKLLIEIVERYVVAFVLVYLSPLAACTLASSATSGIYKKYFTMFISQCILIFLNMWCLKMACSGLNISDDGGVPAVIAFIMCYAFLRVAQKMDSYLNQLGLNAAITGQGLGAELFGAGMALAGGGSGGGGGLAGAAGGAGGKVLGAAKTASTWMRRIAPEAALGDTLKNAAVGAGKGFSEAYRSGGGLAGAAKAAWQGAGKEIANGDNRFANIARHKSGNKLDKTDPGHTEAKLTSNDLTPEQKNANVKDWSENQHLAQNAFAYAKNNDLSVDDHDRVSAVAKGLGAGEVSPEANNLIQAGFEDDKDKYPVRDYKMDKSGIHMEAVSRDGYRHEAHIYDQAQYDKLTTQQREAQNLEKFTAEDGKRYYVGATKTKLDNPGPLGPEGKYETTYESRDEKTGKLDFTVRKQMLNQDNYDKLTSEEQKHYTEGRDSKGRAIYSKETIEYPSSSASKNSPQSTTSPQSSEKSAENSPTPPPANATTSNQTDKQPE